MLRSAGGRVASTYRTLVQGRLAKIGGSRGNISDLPIWIDDTPGLTLMELRAKSRRLRAEKGLGLIVIDYLQLMRSGMRNEAANKKSARSVAR